MTSQEEQTIIPQQPAPDTAPPSTDNALPSSPAPVEKVQSIEDAPTNPRLAALTTRRTALEQTLSDLSAQRSALVARTTLPSGLAMSADCSEEQRTKQALASANAIIKEHIGLLHRYNEIKDIGQGLMGLIADQRGVRVSEAMEDFGVGSKD